MKKISIIFLILSILINLTACATKSPNQTNPQKEPPKANITAPQKVLPQNQNSTEKNTAQNKAADTNASKDFSSLIPTGWHLLEKVKGEPIKVQGDLNKDGIPDIAAVIEGPSQADQAPPRSLLIALGNPNKAYTLSIIAENAILKADEGGVWGDPLEAISIDRGSILLNLYGGSNWRWYSKYRFRFQNNDWYLIGATLGSYFTGTTTVENADEEDYNLLTGDYIIRKTDENGKTTITKGNRGKKKLVKLKDFNVYSEEKQY